MENLEGGGYPSYAHIVKVSCEARVPVLKLHGSVSWSIRNGRLLKYHDCRPAIRGDAAIIAPVTNKAVPDIFQKIWEMAGEALSASSALLVIGYSLPEYDLAVRDLIKRKLPSRSAVHIFDPQPAIATGRNIEFYDRQKVRLCHAVALVLLAQGGRCAAAFRDFYACDDIAQEHFINEINGGAR